ncbi:MAG: class I SAM-dependent methyltransferase [Hyphomicrobiales bacterium]
MMTESEKLLLQMCRNLLAYANPYAQSKPLEPPPAHPSDFKAEAAAKYPDITNRPGWDLDIAAIASALAKDPAPIPANSNRENYNINEHFVYWLNGLAEYRRIVSLAAKHGVSGGRVFDFGGSTGRIFRHFLYQSSDWEVWTCDFKRTSVEWNSQNFDSPKLFAFQGSYHPVLPIEDNSLDLIIAMSVFTHIDETETGWLLELRRVLRPGGLALLTFHNEDTWGNMHERLREPFFKFRPDLQGHEKMPEGRHVSTWRTDDPYRCNVFHSNSYIEHQWGRFFRLKEIIPKFSGVQAVAVLQKT